MSVLANVAMGGAILLAGLSAILLVLGLVSYARIRNARLLWVAVAFAGFLASGLYFMWHAYRNRGAIATGDSELPALVIVDLVIVMALYLAVLKK